MEILYTGNDSSTLEKKITKYCADHQVHLTRNDFVVGDRVMLTNTGSGFCICVWNIPGVEKPSKSTLDALELNQQELENKEYMRIVDTFQLFKDICTQINLDFSLYTSSL